MRGLQRALSGSLDDVSKADDALLDELWASFADEAGVVLKAGDGAVAALQPDTYAELPAETQQAIADGLVRALGESTQHVVRVRSLSRLRVRVVLDLLPVAGSPGARLALLRLLAALCRAGVTTGDFRRMLRLLKEPAPEMRLPLLRALTDSAQRRADYSSSHPQHFFNLGGGPGSGIRPQEPLEWPFGREYAFFAWLRVERFPEGEGADADPQLLALTTAEGHGVVVSLEGRRVRVSVSDPRHGGNAAVSACELRRGHWCSVGVRHSRPRVSLFRRDELCIYVDGEPVFADSVPFPRDVAGPLQTAVVAGGFDGQLGVAYVFKDNLSPALLEELAAGRFVTPAPYPYKL